jgi:hypothetical protein
MGYLFITGIALYIAGIFLERKIDAKGIQMLSNEQREMLGSHFIPLRKRNSIANMILAFGYLGALFLLPQLSPYVLIVGYVTIYLVIFFIVASVYIRGLKAMGFPQAFIRNFISAKFIRVLAFGTFIATLVGAVKSMDGIE